MKDDAPVFYVIAGGWGLCNAIWETLTISKFLFANIINLNVKKLHNSCWMYIEIAEVSFPIKAYRYANRNYAGKNIAISPTQGINDYVRR